MLTHEEELSLIRSAQAGSRRAEDRLIRAFIPKIKALAAAQSKRSALSRDEAESDAMMAALKAIRTYDESRGARLCTWIALVYRDVAWTAFRSERARKDGVGLVVETHEIEDENATSVEQGLHWSGAARGLETFLATIKDRDARIFRSRIEGDVLREIADREGLSVERTRFIFEEVKAKARVSLASFFEGERTAA